MVSPFQGKPRVPRKAPEPPKEKPKPDFFGPKKSLPFSQFTGRLKSASPKIPDSSRWMNPKERESLAERFGKYGKYGPDISRKDVRGVIDELKEEKNKAKTYEEQLKIDQDIRWLKKTTNTS